MKSLHKISLCLLVIGGLNWLLLGIFSWDIGSIFGGQGAVISRIIYILVGLAALVVISSYKSYHACAGHKVCEKCKGCVDCKVCQCAPEEKTSEPEVSTPETKSEEPEQQAM